MEVGILPDMVLEGGEMKVIQNVRSPNHMTPNINQVKVMNVKLEQNSQNFQLCVKRNYTKGVDPKVYKSTLGELW